MVALVGKCEPDFLLLTNISRDLVVVMMVAGGGGCNLSAGARSSIPSSPWKKQCSLPLGHMGGLVFHGYERNRPYSRDHTGPVLHAVYSPVAAVLLV
jgi:hypothetical protein